MCARCLGYAGLLREVVRMDRWSHLFDDRPIALLCSLSGGS